MNRKIKRLLESIIDSCVPNISLMKFWLTRYRDNHVRKVNGKINTLAQTAREVLFESTQYGIASRRDENTRYNKITSLRCLTASKLYII